MKLKKRNLKPLITFFALSILMPVLSFAQDNGQNPDPFDETPPDFQTDPAAPINSFLIYLVLLGVFAGFYFLHIKKGHKVDAE